MQYQFNLLSNLSPMLLKVSGSFVSHLVLAKANMGEYTAGLDGFLVT
jgi:hypothetical protein